MKTYIFKAKLKHNKRTYREIEILENQNLDNLHYAIFGAFNFGEMHLYSFFMSGKAWDKESEYCLPSSEMGGAKSSKKTKIKDLPLEPKQKFLYLFDYGDCWEFEVEFLKNGTADSKAKYPRVIKKAGDSPGQYPDYEEDEE